jgi:plastocyanin
MRLLRQHDLHAAGRGWAAAILFTFTLTGCGEKAGSVDEAVVLPSEPLATSPSGTTAAPAASLATSPSAPAAPAPTATAEAEATTPQPSTGSAEGWGTLKGRVVFNGNPPEPKTLDTSSKDPQVCAKEPHKSQRLVVDPSSKGVRYALVYIPKPTRVNPEAKSAAAQQPVEFDQKSCVFIPHVLAAMKGEKIVLKSSDPVNHNINAKLRVNAPYNNILSEGKAVDFEPPAAERGPVEVTCDIHNWMKAYWLILDNPYFAVTDEQGNFEIKNVPAGTQKVVVWQEAVAYVTPASGENVNIKANDTTTKDFTIDGSKVKPE